MFKASRLKSDCADESIVLACSAAAFAIFALASWKAVELLAALVRVIGS